VAGFGRFALQTDSLQEILDEASRAAAKGLDSQFAKVLEYLPGDMAFVVRAGVGWRDGVVGHARVGGDLLSPAGYAFRTGNPVISNHLAAEQRFRTPQLIVDNRIRSAINVLIQARDSKPFGVLEGDSTNRGDFNNHDITFLEALANSLAVAVEAQRRQDAREQLLREKEALLVENQLLLKEKDLLLREVHHRVKNSLQLVRTILIMQARRLTNPEAKEQVEEAAGRVMTVAAVHQRLYDGGSIAATDAAQYLRGLLADMRGMLLEHAGDLRSRPRRQRRPDEPKASVRTRPRSPGSAAISRANGARGSRRIAASIRFRASKKPRLLRGRRLVAAASRPGR
jgi:two-component sensor histidine kinase